VRTVRKHKKGHKTGRSQTSGRPFRLGVRCRERKITPKERISGKKSGGILDNPSLALNKKTKGGDLDLVRKGEARRQRHREVAQSD